MTAVPSIDWMRAGEDFFGRTIERATPFDRPSLLPGWNRTYLIAHVAGNASGLRNLLQWAATGVETPMYASPQARTEEIERWSAVGTDDLLGHVRETRERLDDAVHSLPDRAWDEMVRTNSGRVLEARSVPWMRAREVYVHAVDLDAGPSFADVPPDVRTALVDDVVGSLSGKPDCPIVELYAGGRRWLLGRAPRAAEAAGNEAAGLEAAGLEAAGLEAAGLEGAGLEGAKIEAPTIEAAGTAELLAWLTGRSSGGSLLTTGALPALPRWL